MLSVIIPFKNDFEIIYDTIDNLNYLQDLSSFEIVVVNDGSVYPNNKFRPIAFDGFRYPNVAVLNNPISRGIGYSFDRGVEVAEGNNIVLMGSDVFPQRSWLTDAKIIAEQYGNSINVATCVGITSENKVFVGKNRYYGADLLIQMGVDDLPIGSKTRRERPNYTNLFKAKWRKGKESDMPYEIPCALGAFYITTKEWYKKIGGFDTRADNKWYGHRYYGHLEPHLSLKSYLHGGNVLMQPSMEIGHLFDRVDRRKRFDKGLRNASDMWWNALWMAETMVLDERLRKQILSFVTPELNFNVAKRRIRQNYSNVLEMREQNKLGFVNSLEYICEKFKIELK